MLHPVLPFGAATGLLSAFLGRSINLFTTGGDIATGLGLKVIWVWVKVSVSGVGAPFFIYLLYRNLHK